MKTVEIRTPAIVTLRVPNTWGPRKIKRLVAGEIIVNRDGKAALRRSQIAKIQLDPALTEGDVQVGEPNDANE